MDSRELDKLAEKLLDTGKGNNLVSFKDRKSSTVEVLRPTPQVLFEKIDGTTTFEVYDPKIADDDDVGDETADRVEDDAGPAEKDLAVIEAQPDGKDDPEAGKKASYLAECDAHIKRQNQLVVYGLNQNPIRSLQNIEKRAKEVLEGTGINIVYMAFGFIHWSESEHSDKWYSAPLLLVPIQLSRESAVEPYMIRSTDDDIIVNPTFSYKLDAEYGLRLPEYTDGSLDHYLQEVRQLVRKLKWTVSSECKIGIFSFQKINMYRDLKDNAETILKNPNVRILLGDTVEYQNSDLIDHEDVHTANPLIELHSVVDADSSQIEAIEMAKAGKSFVLQGPPGTGKSQTITNIIAECLSDGKKVLFVSEKLAALNVVYDKLKQAGLSEFCLELHSHKVNKKDVIEELCRTLHLNKSVLSSKAEGEIELKAKAQRQLDAYAEELHTHRPVIEQSLYELYEAYAALRELPEVEWAIPQLESRGEQFLTEACALLDQYADYVPSVGYDYHKNPWYGYCNQDLSHQTKSAVVQNLQEAAAYLEQAVAAAEKIKERYQIDCTNGAELDGWHRFFACAAETKIITPALLDQDDVDQFHSSIRKMSELSTEIQTERSALDSVYQAGIYELPAEEYRGKLIGDFSGFFSRLFGQEYKQITGAIRVCKKDGSKVSYEEACSIMEGVTHYQEACRTYHTAEESVKPLLGAGYHGLDTDWDDVLNQLAILNDIDELGASYGKLTEFSNQAFVAEQSNFAEISAELDACAKLNTGAVERVAEYFDAAVFDIRNSTFSLLLAHFQDCLAEKDRLDNWCHFRNLLQQIEDLNMLSFLDVSIDSNLRAEQIVGAFKKQFYYQWIDTIISQSQVLSSFTRIAQDKVVDTFGKKDKEQFEINKIAIRAELSSMRPSLDMVAPGSPVAILLREGEKKCRQKSIRTLLVEAGDVIQIIKPCFLMSPLSVSTYLTGDAVHFDVVVFDEASQIFPQDAIGAIYRAKQLIVVGDSKQMPPSNFFNASVETDSDDEDSGDVTDFESILDLCSNGVFPTRRLSWHYRSRYEQLITFSNKNFYDNDLVTFPSSKTDRPGVGVDYYHVDGIFDRKSHTNRKEAEFIVDLIYDNIKKFPKRSLGVVAFSVAQQDLIDKLLSKRRQGMPEAEWFFQEGSGEPFFIKNLETVQGDERDTIIFSIAYGKDAQGKLLHNFGPLNRAGGERRLNVAVTRAKFNVQLVSSMYYTDIDLSRTSSEGARLLREYLDFAQNGEVALERTMEVNRFDQFDSDFEMEVCDFLRGNGFTVDTQVGCSGFKIDLGLRVPGGSDYVLAIECDGATYHSSKNARDRDRLRQEVLERMGWTFYRIWSTDWFRNKMVEKERLLAAAQKAVSIGGKAQDKPESKPELSGETFEEVMEEEPDEFQRYVAADVDGLRDTSTPCTYKGWVRAILEVEAPLSEELLLRRTLDYFHREKITSEVKRTYEQRMGGCGDLGIERRNGFLYLKDHEIVFRVPGDITREIKHIAPEELAEGMWAILKQNMTVDKVGLYRTLAQQCGVSRVGKTINELFDRALDCLKDRVDIEENSISIK